MVQQLRFHTVFSEDPVKSLIPMLGELMTVCDSSSQSSDILFWHPQVLALMCTYPPMDTQIQAHTIKKNKYNFQKRILLCDFFLVLNFSSNCS